MRLNCKVIKNWQPPKKIRTPSVNQFSEGPTPFNNGQGGGGVQLCRFLSNEIDIVRELRPNTTDFFEVLYQTIPHSLSDVNLF